MSFINSIDLFRQMALHFKRDKSKFYVIIRFGTKLYRQMVGIPMVSNCALLIADLFSF